MSFGLKIDLRDGATPELTRLINAATPGSEPFRSACEAIGAAVANQWRENFESLPSNRMGWPTTNFYKRASRSTSYQVESDGATVSCNLLGIRQRFFGGVINAVNAKNLAIPADAESYGKRPAEFGGALRLVVFGRGPGVPMALVATRAVGTVIEPKRGKGKGFKPVASLLGAKVLFWLKKSVTQEADPTVLPTRDAMAERAGSGLDAWWKAVRKG